MLDQALGKLSLTRSSSIESEAMYGGGSTERSLAFVVSTLSLAVRGRTGLPPVPACFQGFRPRRVSHPSPAWLGSGLVGTCLLSEHCYAHFMRVLLRALARRTIQDIDIEQLPCGNDLLCDQQIFNIYMENHLTV